MTKTYILALILGIVAIIAFGALGPLLRSPAAPLAPSVCTQEAKICPDGSAVGRIGPMCQFAPCPNIVGTDLSQGDISAAPASQSVDKGGYAFLVASSSVEVSKDGGLLETIQTDPGNTALDAVDGEIVKADTLISLDQDIDFDGHPDLGILTGVGYGGVNYFYDFYRFDPKSGTFAQAAALTEIGNPSTDPAKKEVISSYRSGPQWYSRRYRLSSSKFIDLGEVPDSSSAGQ